MQLPCSGHAFAMHSPCHCRHSKIRRAVTMQLQCSGHALAMHLLCICNTLAMHLPCICYVQCSTSHAAAMQLPCNCCAIAMQLPCGCHAFPMHWLCNCYAFAALPFNFNGFATPLPRSSCTHAFALQLPCGCHAAAMRCHAEYTHQNSIATLIQLLRIMRTVFCIMTQNVTCCINTIACLGFHPCETIYHAKNRKSSADKEFWCVVLLGVEAPAWQHRPPKPPNIFTHQLLHDIFR